MAGLIFTVSLMSILATVGFLFAWMVRLASLPEQLPDAIRSHDDACLVKEPIPHQAHPQ